MTKPSLLMNVTRKRSPRVRDMHWNEDKTLSFSAQTGEKGERYPKASLQIIIIA